LAGPDVEWSQLPARSRPRSLAAIMLVLGLWTPPSIAMGNHAELVVEAPNSAAASCQVFILVHSLVIIEAEDSLALVTLPARTGLGAQLPALAEDEGSIATCSTFIEEIHVNVPTGLGLAPSFVSGPALAHEPSIVVTGENSDADACQYALMIGSIVIGGGAFGLPTGETSGMVTLNAPLSHGGEASCEAAVGTITIHEGA